MLVRAQAVLDVVMAADAKETTAANSMQMQCPQGKSEAVDQAEKRTQTLLKPLTIYCIVPTSNAAMMLIMEASNAITIHHGM